MSELSDLYQEVILDHNKNPRNFREIENADKRAQGHNPLCGDELNLYLTMELDRVTDVAFKGSGCAISKASASLMTDAVKGHTVDEAMTLFSHVHTMLTLPLDQTVDDETVGKLAVLSGVREFPVRIKCASLAWHTLKQALQGSNQIVKTE